VGKICKKIWLTNLKHPAHHDSYLLRKEKLVDYLYTIDNPKMSAMSWKRKEL